MDVSKENLHTYQKNLLTLQAVADELLSCMKGYDWSYQPEITDGKGVFHQEKLQALVADMLDIWAAKVQEGTDTDWTTGESLAEPWLQERRELYGLYLYVVMRCSLEKGGYQNARDGAKLAERTDFAFLLEQARRLSREWCIVTGRDNTRHNELYWGYDAHFGFHLYYALHDPNVRQGYICTGNDYSLTPDWRRACERAEALTNDGSMKRIYLQHSSRSWYRQPEAWEEEAEEEAETEEELLEEDSSETNNEDSFMDDPDDDILIVPVDDGEEDSELWERAEYDRQSEQVNRECRLTFLAIEFECPGEYCSACERFAELFQNARPEILRDFYPVLEEIVNLYLAQRGTAPLSNTDKVLDIYSRIYDGPYQQAKRYARRMKWEEL